MRKTLYLCICIFVLLSLSLSTASAADTHAELWQPGTYPQDISYAYCAGADNGTVQWEIGLVRASEARKTELRALFPDYSITFTDCSVTFTERTEILQEILDSGEDGIVSGMLMLDSEQVYLIVENSKAAKLASLFQHRYGGIVVVADQNGNIPGAASEFSVDFRLFLIIIAAVAFIIIFTNRYTKLKKSRLDSDA